MPATLRQRAPPAEPAPPAPPAAPAPAPAPLELLPLPPSDAAPLGDPVIAPLLRDALVPEFIELELLGLGLLVLLEPIEPELDPIEPLLEEP
jgi:hypothetical protein